jgi:hypothetical protein
VGYVKKVALEKVTIRRERAMAEQETPSSVISDLRLALKRKGMGGFVRDILLHPGNQAIAATCIWLSWATA